MAKKNYSACEFILDLACGYGRDSAFFVQNGYKVNGIDISDEAIVMGKQNYKDVDFSTGDIFDLPYSEQRFDVVFGNFILHLFLNEKRERIINECFKVIKPNGYVIFSVASVEDPDFEVGKEIEKNYYINARGVMKYYYSKEAIKSELKMFSDISIDVIEEKHEHDFPHTHKSYLVFAKKGGC